MVTCVVGSLQNKQLLLCADHGARGIGAFDMTRASAALEAVATSLYRTVSFTLQIVPPLRMQMMLPPHGSHEFPAQI